MRIAVLCAILFPVLSQAQFGSPRDLAFWGKRQHNVCPDPPTPYLVWQGFECNPFDHGPELWLTNGVSTQINPGYTGTVLAGSKSLQLVGNGTDQAQLQSPDLGALSEVWVYFLFRPVTLPGGAKTFFSLEDDSGYPYPAGQVRWDARLNADGTVTISSSGTATTTGTMSAATTYHVWIHYQAAAPVLDIGFSTDGIRPVSGVNFTNTASVFTQNARSIFLGFNQGSLNYEFLFDNVLVDNAQIGDNPP